MLIKSYNLQFHERPFSIFLDLRDHFTHQPRPDPLPGHRFEFCFLFLVSFMLNGDMSWKAIPLCVHRLHIWKQTYGKQIASLCPVSCTYVHLNDLNSRKHLVIMDSIFLSRPGLWSFPAVHLSHNFEYLMKGPDIVACDSNWMLSTVYLQSKVHSCVLLFLVVLCLYKFALGHRPQIICLIYLASDLIAYISLFFLFVW